MTKDVKLGILATLKAKPGKEDDVAQFLTTRSLAGQSGSRHYGLVRATIRCEHFYYLRCVCRRSRT